MDAHALSGGSVRFFFFFFTLVTGPRRSLGLKLSDTRVDGPQIRARLGSVRVAADRRAPRSRDTYPRLEHVEPGELRGGRQRDGRGLGARADRAGTPHPKSATTETQILHTGSKTRNPKPETPEAQHPTPETRNLKPETRNAKHQMQSLHARLEEQRRELEFLYYSQV